jgi:hypothetical protein
MRSRRRFPTACTCSERTGPVQAATQRRASYSLHAAQPRQIKGLSRPLADETDALVVNTAHLRLGRSGDRNSIQIRLRPLLTANMKFHRPCSAPSARNAGEAAGTKTMAQSDQDTAGSRNVRPVARPSWYTRPHRPGFAAPVAENSVSGAAAMLQASRSCPNRQSSLYDLRQSRWAGISTDVEITVFRALSIKACTQVRSHGDMFVPKID